MACIALICKVMRKMLLFNLKLIIAENFVNFFRISFVFKSNAAAVVVDEDDYFGDGDSDDDAGDDNSDDDGNDHFMGKA